MVHSNSLRFILFSPCNIKLVEKKKRKKVRCRRRRLLQKPPTDLNFFQSASCNK